MSDIPPRDAKAARRPTGLLSVFTPLNVVLLLVVLGGVAAAAITQFGPTAEPPRQRMMISPPPATPGAPPAAPAAISPALAPAFEGIAQGSTLPLFASTPPTPGLSPPPPGTRIPVNKIDLFTDKPITFQSPTKTYKGYVVGFCCANSVGYNGGWDGLTEAEKDTYVRSFLK